MQNNGIHIYQFPTDDESVADTNITMNTHVPFAVVGSTDFVRVGNKMMRSRQYPWGTVQGRFIYTIYISLLERKTTDNTKRFVHENIVAVENDQHCDFLKLRQMLISTNMEDMREKTHCRHYELYRKKRLEQVCFIKHFMQIIFFLLPLIMNFRWASVMLIVTTNR